MNLLEEVYKRKIIPICTGEDFFDNLYLKNQKHCIHFDKASTKNILYGLYVSYHKLVYASEKGIDLQNKILDTLNMIINKDKLLEKIYLTDDPDYGTCRILIAPDKLYINIPAEVTNKTDGTFYQVIDYLASYCVGLFMTFLDQDDKEMIISDEKFIKNIKQLGAKEI